MRLQLLEQGMLHCCAEQALAVLHMLERRAGEDSFKRLLQRIVFASCHPSSAKGVYTTHTAKLRDIEEAVASVGYINSWSQGHTPYLRHYGNQLADTVFLPAGRACCLPAHLSVTCA